MCFIQRCFFFVVAVTMNYFDLPNLASPLLGTQILFATDEWFAAAGMSLVRNTVLLWIQMKCNDWLRLVS